MWNVWDDMCTGRLEQFMNESIIVLKRNTADEVTWQYQGRVLQREANTLVLEAFFNRPDLSFMNIILREGDRFLETFYTDRWYNIFEIYDRDDGKIKGWYCNISKPAVMEDGVVSYVDLALDLWVAADGAQTILDRDEFEGLDLEVEIVQKAWSAMEELQARFKQYNPPEQ